MFAQVVFKMDRYGKGEEIALEKVLNSVDRVPSFRSFDRDLFTGIDIHVQTPLLVFIWGLVGVICVLSECIFICYRFFPLTWFQSMRVAYQVILHISCIVNLMNVFRALIEYYKILRYVCFGWLWFPSFGTWDWNCKSLQFCGQVSEYWPCKNNFFNYYVKCYKLLRGS